MAVPDEDHERLERIADLLQKIQQELASMREESRVAAEQMLADATTSKVRTERRRQSALAAQKRAEFRASRTGATAARKRR
jgi:ribonuclease D